MQLRILNSKEKKYITQLIKKQFDCDYSFSDYELFMNQKNKLFILSKMIAYANLDDLRINSLGLYFGEINRNELRLSIEGAQLIGKIAKKNILELNDEQAKSWMSGKDLEINTQLNGFVIIKNKDDFLGCGRIINKRLLNYVPKERRV